MKRTLAIFLCALLLLSLFAACDKPVDGPGMENTTAAATGEAPVTQAPPETDAPPAT